jgi:hypothetical protein
VWAGSLKIEIIHTQAIAAPTVAVRRLRVQQCSCSPHQILTAAGGVTALVAGLLQPHSRWQINHLEVVAEVAEAVVLLAAGVLLAVVLLAEAEAAGAQPQPEAGAVVEDRLLQQRTGLTRRVVAALAQAGAADQQAGMAAGEVSMPCGS